MIRETFDVTAPTVGLTLATASFASRIHSAYLNAHAASNARPAGSDTPLHAVTAALRRKRPSEARSIS
jgi:hypothetical protein